MSLLNKHTDGGSGGCHLVMQQENNGIDSSMQLSMDEEDECVETLAGLSSNTLVQTIPNASIPGSLGGWIRT